MAQGVSRTHINGSGLVRALGGLTAADVPASKQSFADRLGQWLGFADALTLYSALNAGTPGDAVPSSGAPSQDGEALRQAMVHLRDALTESIANDGVFRPGPARIELPTPDPLVPVESAADFAPYHRYYLAHQRDMAVRVGPLRAMVRAALQGRSGALGRLAALDAVMDQALAARERELLATVPALLGRRFEQCYNAHRATLAETPTADDAARWMQPGGWLAEFCREMQSVLLAEVDLRLQPVAGLIAALDEAVANEVTSKQ
ncbi:DUF3348 domain-containing protein [Aromatoleum petrolei]|uniref:DUF3348 family protein n=1 Tax=Aromatoleum petrolei TaxID=76116 RepID=A0ABX1MMF0_9RHOO|nr:DUF3348 domain-containing protein [Aromatoleum petrolei]NMF87521.1 DUF3348 family protein [Aromatoleum petrolei]QTQ38618.1 putative protein DUF3348 [Aromatoleum petrolei]